MICFFGQILCVGAKDVVNDDVKGIKELANRASSSLFASCVIDMIECVAVGWGFLRFVIWRGYFVMFLVRGGDAITRG